MELKPDASIGIPTPKNIEFFRAWLEIFKPFHKLTNRELDVATSFLWNRYLLSKVINNPELLEETAVNESTKRKIRQECNVTLSHFQVIMSKLKKSGIFKNGRLNPKFIPNIKEDKGFFQLVFLFLFKEDKKV